MKKLFLILVVTLTTSIGHAQLFEGGVFVGGSNYIGDIGPTTYINPNSPAVGFIGKFNYTPRITFRGTLIYTPLKANNQKVNRPISAPGTSISFQNNLVEGAVGIEFSFFKYSLSQTGYTHTPYIIAQAGINSYASIQDDGTSARKFNISLPFGLGYKAKLAENIGIALETTIHYTFKDDIDLNNHNIDIPQRSFGNPNSNDWYVFTGISVVYAFGRPGCYKGFF